MKNFENIFLSNAFWFSKEHFCFESSQNWPSAASEKRSRNVEIIMGNWYLDPDSLKSKHYVSQCHLD